MMALPYMGGMERSLAFTALLDVSRDFRDLESREGTEAITQFLEDYAKFFGVYGRDGRVEMGKTDIYTYARIWVKSYFHYES
jgi:hypothetical protein